MRGTKLINWSTPKHIRILKEHNNPNRHYKNRKKMPKGICKRNHNKRHEYEWIEIHHWLGYHEARCKYCGKKNIELTYSECKLFN